MPPSDLFSPASSPPLPTVPPGNQSIINNPRTAWAYKQPSMPPLVFDPLDKGTCFLVLVQCRRSLERAFERLMSEGSVGRKWAASWPVMLLAKQAHSLRAKLLLWNRYFRPWMVFKVSLSTDDLRCGGHPLSLESFMLFFGINTATNDCHCVQIIFFSGVPLLHQPFKPQNTITL